MEMFPKVSAPVPDFFMGDAPLTGLITLASVCFSQTASDCYRMLLCLCVRENNTTYLCNDYTTENTVITVIACHYAEQSGMCCLHSVGFSEASATVRGNIYT